MEKLRYLIIGVTQERNWVMVEGLNVHYRRVGKTSNFPGQMIQSESPLLVTSEVALVDPFDKYYSFHTRVIFRLTVLSWLLIKFTRKPTTAEWRYTEQGERIRISKRTGLEIPIPKNAEETIDYTTRAGYPGM